jgi:hypothetical protein
MEKRNIFRIGTSFGTISGRFPIDSPDCLT